ncbi:MAG: FAD-dependent oxidoreductase, partial [Nitrospinales bacterium]
MENCRESASKAPDLVIIGGGSAAFAAALKASETGARVAMVNNGLPIGGTCVNVGCIPSKTLIRAAEAHFRSTHSKFAGIESHSRIADFRAIMSQKRELVEELRSAKYTHIASDIPGLRLIKGFARLESPASIRVCGERIETDRILVAAGSSPWIPSIPGLDEVDYLTSETAFELEELPKSLIVLGGRYIALECAQMLSRLGSKVTILQRSSRILFSEAPDLTETLAGYLEREGIEIVVDAAVQGVRKEAEGVVVEANVKGRKESFSASRILVATGRRANTRGLGLEDLGIELDS